MKQFNTPHRERQPIPFEVDGRSFVFTPPKRAKLVLGMYEHLNNSDLAGLHATKDMLDWLSEGLPDEDAQFLLDRIKDPDDEFDMEDLSAIARWAVAEASGRPTKQPSD